MQSGHTNIKHDVVALSSIDIDGTKTKVGEVNLFRPGDLRDDSF